MKITDEEIQKDLEVCEGATEGPWARGNSGAVWNNELTAILLLTGDRESGLPGNAHDACFAVAARTRWPLYIEELKELRDKLKRLDHDLQYQKVKSILDSGS